MGTSSAGNVVAPSPCEHTCEDGNFVYLPNPLERLLPLQCIGKLRFAMHL